MFLLKLKQGHNKNIHLILKHICTYVYGVCELKKKKYDHYIVLYKFMYTYVWLYVRKKIYVNVTNCAYVCFPVWKRKIHKNYKNIYYIKIIKLPQIFNHDYNMLLL